MKILATGDIHGDVSLVKKLAKKAKDEDVDLVLITGDITYFDQGVDGLIGPFKKAGKKVLFIPGNHDSVATADFLTEFYGIKNVHGYRKNMKMLVFLVVVLQILVLTRLMKKKFMTI